MIQAMIWALVFTSGAGMSRLGADDALISVVKRRVSRSSSLMRELLGVDGHAALAAAERDVRPRRTSRSSTSPARCTSSRVTSW